MEPGITGTASMTVRDQDTAVVQGSGNLRVLATPALVALMERATWESVADQLQPGQTTVGTAMDMKHTAPTPVGMAVTCESELVAVDRRALTFEIVARDEKGPIASATHSRFIVDAEAFQAKTEGRKDRANG